MKFKIKKIIFILALSGIPIFSVAQYSLKVDQEKLLDFYQTQRFLDAANYLKTIYTDSTEVAKEISQLAYANMMAGNLTLAEKYYLKLYRQQPKNISVLFSMASISRRRGDDVKAKAYYTDITKIDSTNLNVYIQLAAIVLSPTSSEKINYLKKANLIQPTHPDLAFDLAYSLNLINKNDSAYAVIQTALNADTSNITLLKAKMPICISLSKIDETIRTGTQLMSLGDSSSYVLNNIGKAYFIKKEYRKALEVFENIKNLKQETEAILYYVALCYRELQDYPHSVENMILAINKGISPYTSNYYKALGEIYEKNKMIKKANSSYLRSLTFKNDGSVFYNLGLLNDFKINQKSTALKYYKLYLNIKPDPAKNKKVIDFVKSRLKLLRDGVN